VRRRAYTEPSYLVTEVLLAARQGSAHSFGTLYLELQGLGLVEFAKGGAGAGQTVRLTVDGEAELAEITRRLG